jgi:putative CocE/NonD family hydrolase
MSGRAASRLLVQVEFDVEATMPDGVRLRSNIYRPARPGPWPVLLARIPYCKDRQAADLGLDPVQVAANGYIVVLQDVRGRFSSDGVWDPFVSEASDGAASVAWAASLPGSSGRVGMFGASYLGYAQWAAATQRPAALQAIAPRLAPIRADDGLVSRAGVLELGLLVAWLIDTGFDVADRVPGRDPAERTRAATRLVDELDGLSRGGYRELPLDPFGPISRVDSSPGFRTALASVDHPGSDRISLSEHAEVGVPALHVGGWFDIFLAETLRGYLAGSRSGSDQQLIIGPWTHLDHGPDVGDISFGRSSAETSIDGRESIEAIQLAWFDRHLKVRGEARSRAPVFIFVMGANRWREESEWPLARALPTNYYLRAGGRLSLEAPEAEDPDQYTYDPSDPAPTVGGSTLLTPEFRAGPIDQADLERRDDVLTYTTEALTTPTEASGPIVVHLWAASSARDTDFVARLCDVGPDRRSLNLADGIVRASHRKGPATGLDYLEPGRAYEFEIDLWATSHVFLPGHRIRVQVTSSSFPRWNRNLNTDEPWATSSSGLVATQDILHDARHPSRITLPVVPDPLA